jgi:hypothetical protein
MKLLSLFLLLLTSSFVFERSFPGTADQILTDELGNIFLIGPRRIEKRNMDGKLLFQAADLNYGELSTVDLTNPLMPFAYYREQAKLVFLDNTLSQQGQTIDLFEKGFVQVEAICGSRGDAFWLWDARLSELIRVDRQFNALNSTGNLGVLLGLRLNPVQLIERGSAVYLIDPVAGLIVFDVYGKYRTRLPIFPDGPLEVIEDRLVYVSEGMLHILDQTYVGEEVIPLPVATFRSFCLRKDKLFIVDDKQVSIYRYQRDVKN